MMRTASIAVAALTAALALSPAAQAQKIVYTPGAPGAGDPYFPDMGNGGYDVSGYDITLKFDPATKAIEATTKVNATATQNLSSLNFDFLGLTVDEVKVGSNTAAFARTGAQELVVTPQYGISAGATFSVTVTYHGVPQKIDDDTLGVSGWVATADGAVMLNQPFGAATLFPVNDTPKDKATYGFTITTPSDLTAIANGEQGTKTTTGGLTTVKWKMNQPMASELSMIAIGRFNVTTGRTPDGIRNITAVDTALDTGQGAAFFAGTGAVTDWLQSIWGPYPFASTGGVIDRVGVGYALETQGRPVYDTSRAGRVPSNTLIAHEVGHQYFGDSVTPAAWKDIWLNEGFATYNEWLWTATHGGRSVQESFDDTYDQPASAAVWQPVMSDPGRDGIFDETVYDRGAMTLHALRTAIGDDAFFELGRRWVAENRYGSVTTADFQALAEQVSGQDLDDLFTKWAYTPGKPSL
ncbi:M1 family metallopeptidase [Actinocorallia longicatena]|uniref:Aminopeptidase N n=1 Tax=Actinocorallia longicatena TaxID=111803 RepID=A0ABP6Q4R3_9ACTN